MRTAFVTGATGFVGLNLVQELTRTGWEVTCLHRPTSDLTYLKRFPVKLVPGSITDPASLLTAIPENIDALFHVAGNTSFWAKRNAEQTADNVDGTRNVVAAALARKTRKLILTSSISAYGDQSGEVTESTPSNAPTSWINYQRSKWLAEAEVRKGIRAGLPAVIMNPGGIVGPFDADGWGRLFKLVQERKLPGVPSGALSFGHAREVVRAHIAAVDQGKVGENYLLAGTDASFLELVGIIGELLDRPVPKRPVPTLVLQILARIQTAIAARTGRPPTLTPETVATVSKRLTCPSIKAQRILGYKLVPLRTMLQDNYDWLVAEGKLTKA